MRCEHCGGALVRDVDPMDLAHPEYVCVNCGRVHGLKPKRGTEPDPVTANPRLRVCEFCGRAFALSKRSHEHRFCSLKCGIAGRSYRPKQSRAAR